MSDSLEPDAVKPDYVTPGPAPRLAISINGQPMQVAAGTTVAAAVLQASVASFRRSVRGEPRAALCGMGICFECRLSIDGHLHQRSCQIQCREGMEVVTDG